MVCNTYPCIPLPPAIPSVYLSLSVKGQAAPEGLKVQATIMWRAKRENHLSFDKGDIITVHEQQDNWWSGELNNKVVLCVCVCVYECLFVCVCVCVCECHQ